MKKKTELLKIEQVEIDKKLYPRLEYDFETAKRYAEMMKSGTKFDLPYLDYKRGDQEGRARALAAKQLGASEIPVVIAEEYEPTPPAPVEEKPIEATKKRLTLNEINRAIEEAGFDERLVRGKDYFYWSEGD